MGKGKHKKKHISSIDCDNYLILCTILLIAFIFYNNDNPCTNPPCESITPNKYHKTRHRKNNTNCVDYDNYPILCSFLLILFTLCNNDNFGKNANVNISDHDMDVNNRNDNFSEDFNHIDDNIYTSSDDIDIDSSNNDSNDAIDVNSSNNNSSEDLNHIDDNIYSSNDDIDVKSSNDNSSEDLNHINDNTYSSNDDIDVKSSNDNSSEDLNHINDNTYSSNDDIDVNFNNDNSNNYPTHIDNNAYISDNHMDVNDKNNFCEDFNHINDNTYISNDDIGFNSSNNNSCEDFSHVDGNTYTSSDDIDVNSSNDNSNNYITHIDNNAYISDNDMDVNDKNNFCEDFNHINDNTYISNGDIDINSNNNNSYEDFSHIDDNTCTFSDDIDVNFSNNNSNNYITHIDNNAYISDNHIDVNNKNNFCEDFNHINNNTYDKIDDSNDNSCTAKLISSKTLTECSNEYIEPLGKNGFFVARIPVVISELKVEISCTATTKLTENAAEIKRVTQDVCLTNCKLITKINELFIKGHIKRTIEYVSNGSSKHKKCEGKLKHLTVNIPFECTTNVKYFTPPEIKGNEDIQELTILDGNIIEHYFIDKKCLNEKVYCELVKTKILGAYVQEENTNEINITDKLTFKELDEQMVLYLTLRLLQNQQLNIASSERK